MKKIIMSMVILILFFIIGCTPEENTFRIKFVTNYDVAIEDMEFEKNSNINLEMLPNLTRDNYYFEGWFIDEDFIIPVTEVVLNYHAILYAKWVDVDEVLENQALNAITLISETYQDITLPSQKNGFDITWSSNKENVLSSQGKYTEVTSDTEVILTAKIVTEIREYKRVFIVTAKPYPYDDYFAIAFSSIKFTEALSKDITLPTKFNNNITGTWESSNPEVISADGKVKLTENEETVHLTLTLTLNQEKRKLSFEVKTIAKDYDLLFATAIAQVNLPNEVKANLTLPTDFYQGIKGTWVSSKPGIIGNDGKVTLTDNVERVTLTLTLTLDDEEREYTFEVTTAVAGVTVEQAEYFINRLKVQNIDVNTVLMNDADIASYNQTVLNSTGTKVVDLTKIASTISKTTLSNLINTYSNINSYTIYNNTTGKAISSTDKTAILNNRNLNNISDSTEVKYAVSVTHTNLRTYPTMYYASTNEMDRFQETGFSAGIPLVIYHTSLDNNWYFVQMYNYFGWVQATDVGLCDRATFLKYCQPEKFVVVLGHMLDIDGERVRMGYKLPYVSKNETNYQIEMPKRDANGNLTIKIVDLNVNSDVSDGFIPYTYTNLLTQAFKMLHVRYSWGDKVVDAFDCSSTQASIYACFGFINGRNTSNQWKTNIYGKTQSVTNTTMKNYQVGTLIYTSTHVLMYIGVDADGNCWVLHNTSTGNICKVQTLTSFGVGGINHVLEVRKMN